ncbi:Permease of the drug/metabolite transporter (DMT) superfamily [Lutimaribacter pacificus]|uniref:Permease of the drug/metabolite transporter (DMT) superfamily n=1 Tax=Lutimaribacter pacificus TaxID=391948 RepID=A0A1H0F3Q6_9RHOB|nr:DMT family transporter [Lutimaribacter pacificus]SDN89294.1 Permease of the drug/metabolite transporter (DMT) superfamily [Lutimaribacter pacificus]SHK44482.1 Permease of the drug/metabolite transporter (DMT) superfamily [Lutimaribacter pacificus]
MERKDHIDLFGAVSLVGFACVLAFNQVVIKVGTGGFQPVFMAGLRSLGALAVLIVWMRLRGVRVDFGRRYWASGILLGSLFAFEFVCLFWALDNTTVSRASILFYTMPMMLAGAAHFVLPGERLTLRRAAGLVTAMAGVALVLSVRKGGEASVMGDIAALAAAAGWAGIALTVRLTPVAEQRPEMQLMWQLTVSSVLLIAAAFLFGPLLRDLQPVHYWALLYQVVVVASLGYMFWFFLMAVYPASGVASFSFLSPVLSVFFGWALLGEEVGRNTVAALVMVAIGLVLINRRHRPQGGA